MQNDLDDVSKTIKKLEEYFNLFENIKAEFKNDSERKPLEDTTKIGKVVPKDFVNNLDNRLLNDPQSTPLKEIDLNHFESNEDIICFLKIMYLPTNLKKLDKEEFIKRVRQFHELFDIFITNLPFILASAKDHKIHLTKDQLLGSINESAISAKIKNIYSKK